MGLRWRTWSGVYVVAAGCWSTTTAADDVPADTGPTDRGAVVMDAGIDAGMDVGMDTGAPDRTGVDVGIDRPADRGPDVTGIDRGVDTGPDGAGLCPSSCTQSAECEACHHPGDPGGYCCFVGLCLYMSGSCDAGVTGVPEVGRWELEDRPMTSPDAIPAWGDVTSTDGGSDSGSDASGADVEMDGGAAMDGAAGMDAGGG